MLTPKDTPESHEEGTLNYSLDTLTNKKQVKLPSASPYPTTLEAIVEYLIDKSTGRMNILVEFFKLYRFFTTAIAILKLLISRFHDAVNHEEPGNLTQEQARVLVILRVWLENHGHDFKRDIQLTDHLSQYIETSLKIYPTPMKDHIQALLSKPFSSKFKINRPSPRMVQPLDPMSVTVLHINTEEIARQYALIMHSFIAKIMPHELVSYNMTGLDTLAHQQYTNLIERISRNIEIEFNRCQDTEIPLLIDKYIEIMVQSRKINNWQLIVLIVKVLNYLKEHEHVQIWEKVKRSNVDTYREIRKTTESPQLIKKVFDSAFPPGIPVMDIYIKDIRDIEKMHFSMSKPVPGYIDVDLYRQIYQSSSTLETFQQVKYSYNAVETIQSWILYPFTIEELCQLNLKNRFHRKDNLQYLFMTYCRQCPFSGGMISKEDIMMLIKGSGTFREKFSELIQEVVQEYMYGLRKTLIQHLKEHVTVLESLNQMKHDVFAGYKFSEWRFNDEKGQLYGIPLEITIDVIEHQQGIYLCDVREELDTSRVSHLNRLGILYRRIYPNTQVGLVVITKKATQEAIAFAKKISIRTIVDNRQSPCH